MKIWILEIGEPLPTEEGARLLRYGMWSEEFARLGHEITWWTSSFSHFKKRFLYHENREEMVKGVRLKIIHGPGYKTNVSISRVLHQRHFAQRFYELATIEAKSGNLPDVIISPIPTLEVSEAAIRFGKENNLPVLIDMRDEWPDELVDLFPPGFRWAGRLCLSPFFQKMRWICRNATGILGVSQRFLNYGLKFANRSQGTHDRAFPIGYSLNQDIGSDQVQVAKIWWLDQGVDSSSFVCCLFASLGPFFNLETVIRAVEILSQEFKIQFVACGNGSTLPHLKKLAAGNPSVIFPGWVDAPKISALMDLSTVGIAPYSESARMTLPNKPFEYFAGSLPVISSIQGELKELLLEHKCGRTYRANSVEELCSIFREFHNNPQLCKEMGKRARNLLETHYTVEIISKKVLQHLEQVIKEYGNQKLSFRN